MDLDIEESVSLRKRVKRLKGELSEENTGDDEYLSAPSSPYIPPKDFIPPHP